MSELITTTIVLATVTLFSVGIIIGWFISTKQERSPQSNVRTMVAVVVTLGWITATLSGIAIASYTVSPLLHALMGAIVGYFFTDDGINLNIGDQNG